jgi:hypothetical protein
MYVTGMVANTKLQTSQLIVHPPRARHLKAQIVQPEQACPHDTIECAASVRLLKLMWSGLYAGCFTALHHHPPGVNGQADGNVTVMVLSANTAPGD